MSVKVVTETHDLIPIEDIHLQEGLHSYLRMFMVRVRRVFPKCQFAIATRSSGNVVHVYHDWKPLTMGKIGWGNFRNEGGEDNFMVASPTIRNEKYASYSDQHSMKLTKKLDVAERNVKSFLRDVSPVDLAEHYGPLTRRSWNATKSELGDKIRTNFNQMLDLHRHGDTILREFQNLTNTDYKFLDPEFEARVKEVIALHEQNVEAMKSRCSEMMMVSVEQKGDSAKFTLLHTSDISNHLNEWSPLGSFTEDTLQANHPDVLGKLAMLQMCEVGQWVDGVGWKPTPTVYYVAS